MRMMSKSRFTITLLSLGLAASWGGGAVAQTVAPAPAPAATAESSSTAAKKEWRVPTGEHWTKASDTEKAAYILGLLNLAMIEYQLSGPNPKHRTTVPKLISALNGMTVPQVVETIDAYYKANPDLQQTPIVEVLWFQIVVPKVGPAKIK
ncbi:MAG TPA: hypothetical protein PKI41_04875 [Candidatus Competibacteraceae bacterium]|nr:hypothetical protein [Candidatus Competibacteraceae bacterium]HQA25486.1 hypothetical protein [Candidatus Competibacteraceae bacterium]HQD55911.1 hypothetical protein [Candidatus Competibacteraceae bacterium]